MQADKPSPLFLQTVQDIGQQLGLDADKIAAGEAIEFKETIFWIGHDGENDPDGLILYIGMGEIVKEFEAMAFRHVLECNAALHSPLSGHYCLLPETNMMAFCGRMDMAKSEHPAETVLAYVGLYAHQVDEITNVMEKLSQVARDAVDSQVASAAAQEAAA